MREGVVVMATPSFCFLLYASETTPIMKDKLITEAINHEKG